MNIEETWEEVEVVMRLPRVDCKGCTYQYDEVCVHAIENHNGVVLDALNCMKLNVTLDSLAAMIIAVELYEVQIN